MAHVTKNGEERARNPPRKHLMEAEEALVKSTGCEPMHQAVGASPEKIAAGGKQGQEGGLPRSYCAATGWAGAAEIPRSCCAATGRAGAAELLRSYCAATGQAGAAELPRG